MSLRRYQTGQLEDYEESRAGRKSTDWEASRPRKRKPLEPEDLPASTLGGDLVDGRKIPADLPEE